MPSLVKKTDKRKLIINAALFVFSRDGFQRSKMEEIAKTADIGKGTLYEYFSSKEELFLEVFSQFKESVLSRYWLVLKDDSNPLSKLQRVAKISSDICEDENIHMKFHAQFYLECINREEGNPLREILNEYHEELSALITGIVKEGIEEGLLKPVDADLISQVFSAALNGLYMNYQLEGDKMQLQAASESLYTVFIKGTGTVAGRDVDNKY